MKFSITFILTMFMAQAIFAATPDEDVAAYIARFQGPQDLHHKIAEDFQWVGLSDPRLFDLIEKKLLAEAESASGNSTDKNRVARYMRDLGYSGNAKYLPTLQLFTNNYTYSKYAKEAINDLPIRQKWNPIITNRANFDPAHSDEVNRVANMLRADDMELNALGAKRIYFSLYENAYLVDLLSQKVKANFMVAQNASYETAQAVAWMVKGLGSSRDEKYHNFILEISNSGTNSTVTRHAKTALKRDYENAAAPSTGSHTGEN